MTALVAVVRPSEDGSPWCTPGVGFAPPSSATPSSISACLRRVRVISQQLNSTQARLFPRALVSDVGYVSIEIAHLLKLNEGDGYDTIYHEHS
jgi:hypothetical protein